MLYGYGGHVREVSHQALALESVQFFSSLRYLKWFGEGWLIWIASPPSFFSKIVTPKVCLENTSTLRYRWHVVFFGFDEIFFSGWVWVGLVFHWKCMNMIETLQHNGRKLSWVGKNDCLFFSWETWPKNARKLEFVLFFYCMLRIFCEVLRKDVLPRKLTWIPKKGWFGKPVVPFKYGHFWYQFVRFLGG